MKQRLVQVVEAKKFRSYTDDLMKQAKVETYLDAQTDSQTSGKSGPPEAPAAAAGAPPPAGNGG